MKRKVFYYQLIETLDDHKSKGLCHLSDVVRGIFQLVPFNSKTKTEDVPPYAKGNIMFSQTLQMYRAKCKNSKLENTTSICLFQQ